MGVSPIMGPWGLRHAGHPEGQSEFTEYWWTRAKIPILRPTGSCSLSNKYDDCNDNPNELAEADAEDGLWGSHGCQGWGVGEGGSTDLCLAPCAVSTWGPPARKLLAKVTQRHLRSRI